MISTQKPTAVVFDVGNVLVRWDPRFLYENHFEDKAKLNWFLSEVVNLKWHTEHDRGLSFAQGCSRLAKQYPDYADLIYLFKSNWRQTISGQIPGSVKLLERLSQRGIKLYAISNYSAETFPDLVEEFSFMKLFDDIVISGKVGTVKPEPEIFEIAMKQFNLTKGQALFIDDRQENIDAGEVFGLVPHLFTSPDKLEKHLKELSLLA